jgi:hypothetical protein
LVGALLQYHIANASLFLDQGNATDFRNETIPSMLQPFNLTIWSAAMMPEEPQRQRNVQRYAQNLTNVQPFAVGPLSIK